MDVRKGDTIVVLGGKDRGKRGKIERVQTTRRGLAVVVPGINMAKRHQKARGGRAQTAGIIELPMPLQISNVHARVPQLRQAHPGRARAPRRSGQDPGPGLQALRRAAGGRQVSDEPTATPRRRRRRQAGRGQEPAAPKAARAPRTAKPAADAAAEQSAEATTAKASASKPSASKSSTAKTTSASPPACACATATRWSPRWSASSATTTPCRSRAWTRSSSTSAWEKPSRTPRRIDAAVGDLVIITGQKPIVTRATRSIAQFRLRTGMPVGAKVTLRGQRMYDFLERTMRLALPRIRDFRGVSARSFDGRGNYSLGFREQLMYPEIDYDKIDRLRGFEISIVTTAQTDEEGRRLLALLGMPFAAN